MLSLAVLTTSGEDFLCGPKELKEKKNKKIVSERDTGAMESFFVNTSYLGDT